MADVQGRCGTAGGVGASIVGSSAPARRNPMATADEVRAALFERIAYHTVSADAQEVLALAKAYSYLVDADDDDDDEDADEEDEDEDDDY
jgi:hypothetical protein